MSSSRVKVAVEGCKCRLVNLTIPFLRNGKGMNVKSVKNGIEGLSNVVLNIADVIHRGGATSVLLSNSIKVPYKLEGAFVVLLAHENLVGHVVEIANELVTVSRRKGGLEDIEYKIKSSFDFPALRGIYRGFIVIARGVLLEQESRGLERYFKAFYCVLSVLSVIP